MSSEANQAVKAKTVQPVPPQRWLVIQASAALETVAATNYVCYGGAKVPRYGITNPPPPPQDPAALCAEIIARGPTVGLEDGALRLAELDTRFRLVEQSERQVIWVWADPARWFQAYWVWDFFRLLSHSVLRVGLPASEQVADMGTPWADLLTALRAIVPGDTLSVRVQSPCGNIQQMHPITAAASEWRPPVQAKAQASALINSPVQAKAQAPVQPPASPAPAKPPALPKPPVQADSLGRFSPPPLPKPRAQTGSLTQAEPPAQAGQTGDKST